MSTHNYLTLMSEEFPDRCFHIGSEGREEIEAVINEEGFKPEEEWEEEFDHDEFGHDCDKLFTYVKNVDGKWVDEDEEEYYI